MIYGHLFIEIEQRSVDWLSWHASIGKKWWKYMEIGSLEKKAKYWKLMQYAHYRYVVSLLRVSWACNLVGVASRWYFKVAWPTWDSRIPIRWFGKGQLPKIAKNRSKSDLIVCVEKIGDSQEARGCRYCEYFRNPGDRRVILCVTGTVWGSVPKHQVTGEKHSI